MPEPQISRKQAWCKLAILIAEGAPTPASVQFFPPSTNWNGLDIAVDDAGALWKWAALLQAADLQEPRFYETLAAWHQAAKGVWHGFDVTVKTYYASTLGEAAGMDAVRAIAEPTCVCCNPGDCGDRRGHIEVVGVENTEFGPENYDRCNCGRDWPCEKAGVES